MSFTDNLLNKIHMDRFAETALKTIGPVDSGLKLDREAMRGMMAMLLFQVRYERDLELYVENVPDGKARVLVLDNELALYRTTVEDVVLRKSPTVKEMVNIRNAIKILSDKDVVICKRGDTVRSLRDEFIAGLDLTHTRADIEALAEEGKKAFESEKIDAVQDILACFYDLLECREAPKPLHIAGHAIWGAHRQPEGGSFVFGPFVIFTPDACLLKWVEKRIDPKNPDDMRILRQIAFGAEKAGEEGRAVFDRLVDAVIEKES